MNKRHASHQPSLQPLETHIFHFQIILSLSLVWTYLESNQCTWPVQSQKTWITCHRVWTSWKHRSSVWSCLHVCSLEAHFDPFGDPSVKQLEQESCLASQQPCLESGSSEHHSWAKLSLENPTESNPTKKKSSNFLTLLAFMKRDMDMFGSTTYREVNAFGFAEISEHGLLPRRVTLHLVNSWRDTSHLQENC